MSIGKEEYAEIDCSETESCNSTTKNERPHLFGVGAPINISERKETYTINYEDSQSVSHNVGIYVWGAYQVKIKICQKKINEYQTIWSGNLLSYIL